MAYTTIYTSNINYPTNYFRAYVEYQLTETATAVTVDMKYGVALHSGYSSTSWEQVSRQVACSIGTGHDASKATSYDIYNGAWTTDSTQLGKTADGNSWWHQTGTASKTISKTSSAQTLYVLAWGKVNGVQGTTYATITIPRLARVAVTYHVNGGTISENPHKYDDTHYFKVSSSYINLSSTSSGTYSKYTTYLYRGNTHYNAYNYASFGLTKTGYHGKSTAEWNLNSSGTSTSFNEEDTTSNTTNTWTTKRLNGGTELGTSDVNVVLYANWEANTYTVNYNANGGSGTTASSSHTYGTAKALTTNGFSKTGYSFYGWATTQAKADAGTRDYTNGQSVSNLTTTNGGTVTLYAVWTPYTMTFKFHANGGTIADEPHEANSTRFYKLSSSIVQYSDAADGTYAEYHQSIDTEDTYKDLLDITTFNITKTGYHVISNATYNTASDGSGIKVSAVNTSSDSTNAVTTKRINGGTQISSNVTKTLYVDWVPNTWIIHFDGNGNTGGSMSDQTHTRGTPLALPPNGFTKTGYTFAGWQWTSESSGTVYTYEDEYEMSGSWAGATSTGVTYTLVAQWTKNVSQWVQINGTWKEVVAMWVQIGNAWKQVSDLSVNINNTWKKYSSDCTHANAQTVKLSYCIGAKEWDCCADVGEYQNFTICPNCGAVYVSATGISGESMSCEDCDTLSDWDNYRDRWLPASIFTGLTNRSEYKAIYTK